MSGDSSVDGLLMKLRSFVQARSMQEHWQAYTIFSETVGWDVPPILLEGREKLRVVAYMAKRIAKLDFEKHSVKVEPPVDGHKQVSMICTFHVTVLPAFLPIPTIKLKATVDLGVSDDFHKVTSIYGRIHNFPCLPDFIRRTNAYCLGTIGVATEPWWSQTVWLYGDHSYQNKTK